MVLITNSSLRMDWIQGGYMDPLYTTSCIIIKCSTQPRNLDLIDMIGGQGLDIQRLIVNYAMPSAAPPCHLQLLHPYAAAH